MIGEYYNNEALWSKSIYDSTYIGCTAIKKIKRKLGIYIYSIKHTIGICTLMDTKTISQDNFLHPLQIRYCSMEQYWTPYGDFSHCFTCYVLAMLSALAMFWCSHWGTTEIIYTMSIVLASLSIFALLYSRRDQFCEVCQIFCCSLMLQRESPISYNILYWPEFYSSCNPHDVYIKAAMIFISCLLISRRCQFFISRDFKTVWAFNRTEVRFRWTCRSSTPWGIGSCQYASKVWTKQQYSSSSEGGTGHDAQCATLGLQVKK